MVGQNSKIDGRFMEVWTSDEAAVLKANWFDHSVDEMLVMLPRFGASAIRAKANRMGLKKDFGAKRARGIHIKARPKKPHVGHILKDRTRGIIAFEVEGVKMFDNAIQASRHYGIREDRIYYLIASEEQIWNGTTFNYITD